MPSHYEILGVGADAGDEEIRAAYDALLNQCYAGLRDPKTHDACVQRIKLITLARDVLLDPEQRRQYDTKEEEELAEKAAPLAPSLRFLARCFDQLAFWGVFYLIYKYFADYVFFEDWTLALAFALVGIVLYVLVEAAEFALFGTTLGKWATGLETVLADGRPAPRLLLVRRNFLAALQGLAFYVPPFSFAAMFIQYRKLKKAGNGGVAPWDRACGTVVRASEKKNRLRLLVAAAVVLLAVVDVVRAIG